MKQLALIAIFILVTFIGHTQVVYKFNGNGNWDDTSKWLNNSTPPDTLLSGDEIIIDSNSKCYLNIPQTISAGAFLVVQSGANFIVMANLIDYNGNGNTTNSYATDTFPNKVGDSWLYLVNDTTVNRSTPHDSAAVQYNMTVSVIDSVQLPQGIEANIWVYNYTGGIGIDTNYVYQKGDTIRFLDETKSYIVRQYIVPLSLHNSWQYVQGIDEVTVDTQADIIVEQNLFNNVFNIYGDAGFPDGVFSIDEWVENNVGVVKRHFDPSGELIDPRHVIAWSLLSFHLK